MKANSIEEYLGTLQQSMVEAWKEHLKTDKYSAHKALNDFYDEIVDLVDALVEDYQGVYGKVKDLKNVMSTDKIGAVEYLEELRKFAEEGRDAFLKKEDTELSSDVDAILSCIDSTLYKLKELKEGKVSLVNFLKESLTEARAKKIKQLSFDEFLATLKAFDANAQEMDFEPVLNGDEFSDDQKITADGVKTVKEFYEWIKKEYGNMTEDDLDSLFNDYLPGE